MIAFMLDAQTAEELAIPGGEPAEDMHLTLAYLGDLDDLNERDADWELLKAALAHAASVLPPMEALIAGYGRFTPDGADKHPLIALVDICELSAWRERLLGILESIGAPVSHQHGFIPHITLDWLAPDDPMPDLELPVIGFRCSAITLAMGDTRISWPLEGDRDNVGPAQRDLLLRAEDAVPYRLERADRNSDAAALAALLAAYALDTQAIKDLAAGIYAARIGGFTAAYRDSIAESGQSMSGDWEPPDALLTTFADASLVAAKGIADTYHTILKNRAQLLADQWRAAHPDAPSLTQSSAQAEVAAGLSHYVSGFADWKAEQIGGVEAGIGWDTGIAAFVADVQAGAYPDVSPEMLVVVVLPDESSADECAEYAGNSYPLSEYDNIPPFPIHPGCPHYKAILANGVETDLNI